MAVDCDEALRRGAPVAAAYKRPDCHAARADHAPINEGIAERRAVAIEVVIQEAAVAAGAALLLILSRLQAAALPVLEIGQKVLGAYMNGSAPVPKRDRTIAQEKRRRKKRRPVHQVAVGVHEPKGPNNFRPLDVVAGQIADYCLIAAR